MRIDIHAHLVPLGLPDLAGSSGDSRWPNLLVDGERGRIVAAAGGLAATWCRAVNDAMAAAVAGQAIVSANARRFLGWTNEGRL